MHSKVISLILHSFLSVTVIQTSSISSQKKPFTKLEINQAYGISSDFHEAAHPFKKIENLEKYYYISNETSLNWYEAMHRCRKLGGDLVNFQNDKELDAVLNDLSKRKCYWIDLTDFAQRRQFHSISTGHLVNFTRWGKNEPNDLGGNEHCVQLVVAYNRRTFGMNDNKCHNLCSFICETKLPLQTNIVVW